MSQLLAYRVQLMVQVLWLVHNLSLCFRVYHMLSCWTRRVEKEEGASAESASFRAREKLDAVLSAVPQHDARKAPRAAADGEGGGPALAWLVAPRVCPYYSHLP